MKHVYHVDKAISRLRSQFVRNLRHLSKEEVKQAREPLMESPLHEVEGAPPNDDGIYHLGPFGDCEFKKSP